MVQSALQFISSHHRKGLQVPPSLPAPEKNMHHFRFALDAPTISESRATDVLGFFAPLRPTRRLGIRGAPPPLSQLHVIRTQCAKRCVKSDPHQITAPTMMARRNCIDWRPTIMRPGLLNQKRSFWR